MKNPLDSLGQTVALGVVLTIVLALLIHVIASA
jgi:predicted exporter